MSPVPLRSLFFVGMAAASSGAVASGLGAHPLLVLLTAAIGGSVAGWLALRGGSADEPGGEQRRPRDSEHQIAATIADANPDAVLFFSDTGAIRFANTAARELFFEGRDPSTENFLQLLSGAPAPLREALLGEESRLVSLQCDDHLETYHVMRKNFELGGELHTLLAVKHLSREIARQEVEVLKRVVRVVSHEANNSLAPISSLVHSARIVAKGPEPASKLERIFSTIEERADHLRSFLDGYAKVARLPAPRPREVAWEPLLAQLASLYPQVKFPKAPAEPGWFDAGQLEQVLINLLKNAIEAGGEASAVELELTTAASGACEIRIVDRGHGFSEEALRNAFLPLYSTKPQGSGMGLALAREIVEAHGGSLSLANRAGGGASVALRLPGRDPQSTGLGRSRLTLTRG